MVSEEKVKREKEIDANLIYTSEDIKKVAEDILQLVTDCLKEFMAGYRKGRDDEIDKMLNEYFKEEEEKNDDKSTTNHDKNKKRRRRKPKRAELLRE